MRDKIRDKEYFDKSISMFYESIERVSNWVEIGKTPTERVNHVKRSIVQSYISILKCKYSIGLSKEAIVQDLKNRIQKCYESWDGFWKLDYNGKILNQYTLSAYDEMLWMLALGFLLDIPNQDFKKLVEVIDRDGSAPLISSGTPGVNVDTGRLSKEEVVIVYPFP